MNRKKVISQIQKIIEIEGSITVDEIMATWGCSHRTAKEYIRASLTKPLEIYEEDDAKDKWLNLTDEDRAKMIAERESRKQSVEINK